MDVTPQVELETANFLLSSQNSSCWLQSWAPNCKGGSEWAPHLCTRGFKPLLKGQQYFPSRVGSKANKVAMRILEVKVSLYTLGFISN